MRKLLITLASLFGLSVSQSAIAMAQQIPTDCPSTQAIKAAGLHDLTAEMPTNVGTWFSANFTESYSTKQTWTFVIGNIKAYSADDAKTKALQGLESLQFLTGPERGPLGKWVCRYSTAEGYTALAMTPPVRGNVAPILSFRWSSSK